MDWAKHIWLRDKRLLISNGQITSFKTKYMICVPSHFFSFTYKVSAMSSFKVKGISFCRFAVISVMPCVYAIIRDRKVKGKWCLLAVENIGNVMKLEHTDKGKGYKTYRWNICTGEKILCFNQLQPAFWFFLCRITFRSPNCMGILIRNMFLA